MPKYTVDIFNHVSVHRAIYTNVPIKRHTGQTHLDFGDCSKMDFRRQMMSGAKSHGS